MTSGLFISTSSPTITVYSGGVKSSPGKIFGIRNRFLFLVRPDRTGEMAEVHTHALIHTHTHTLAYTQTHTYTHTPKWVRPRWRGPWHNIVHKSHDVPSTARREPRHCWASLNDNKTHSHLGPHVEGEIWRGSSRFTVNWVKGSVSSLLEIVKIPSITNESVEKSL